ncbi:putative ARM REPEAT PROTEIN INTERACTING WITH ABF2-like isoform [Sesbania bispinosa]|nr:putative ARM REPEAT PROTEIN INTERACTING WITH ABF2-like isoform [Sesbania bispinosa]
MLFEEAQLIDVNPAEASSSASATTITLLSSASAISKTLACKPPGSSSCLAFGATAASSGLFLMHDVGKDSTAQLGWKSSSSYLNFGSFELEDPSSFCNLKTEEAMDEICSPIDQRRQDQSLSERKGEKRNLDEEAGAQIQQSSPNGFKEIVASLEEQSVATLPWHPTGTCDFILTSQSTQTT